MIRPMHKLATFAGSTKGAKIILISWLLVIVILSGIAPSAKKFAVSSGEGSIHENTPSAVAKQLMEEQFPSDDGLPALLVFHGHAAITAEERATIKTISQWLSSADKPEHVASSLPFHQLPEPAQDKLLSVDRTTLLLNVTLQKGLESDQIYDTLKQIRTHVEQSGLGGMQFEITGPGGIAADTISLFKNADFVLMFATVGLILIILIVIYRSPLLAVIPLVIAGLVYQVVDRLLGLAAKNGWFVVDKQTLSIMMILLFAVLTDYCLFIFARYREELKKIGSKYDAMKIAMTHVAEPILFSGGTVFVAMLALLAAVFKPYHNFAPVFATAMVVILLGGLTLIPAVFALVGRKAFWPFVPKLEEKGALPSGFWTRMGAFVTRKPGITAALLSVILVIAAVNASTMKFSFNLMKSFPDNVSSRQGFEILEQQFPQGQLAPVSVVLKSDKDITIDQAFAAKLAALKEALKKEGGITAISPDFAADPAKPNEALPAGLLSKQKHAVQLQMILADNPYDQKALDLVKTLRADSEKMLRESGFDPLQYSLHFAGQTADQLDVREMNQRDTITLFVLIACFITVMLGFQARSVMMPILMMATILLSYAATLGLGWLIFHNIMGYESISYRLPVYVFVFLVALGVDYNIMLVSRIKEEAAKRDWKEAVGRGVTLTGGVISSAGFILAATFGVLITQPLQELFLFGLTMAMGIIIDTFFVRGMLLPSIMTLIGKRRRNRHEGASAPAIRR